MKNSLLIASSLASGFLLSATAPVFANTGSTTASVPALTPGMTAPTVDVGTATVQKGTVQYSNSVGSSDAFSVGAMTNVGSSVNASSTPDYDVTSKAVFGIGTSTINQQIGTATAKVNSTGNTITDVTETAKTITEAEVKKDFVEDTSSRGGWWWWNRRNNTRTHISDDEKSTVETNYKKDILTDVTETLNSTSSNIGTISGSFNKTFATDGNTNDVTVNGIGTDAKIIAGTSSFDADIIKNKTEVKDENGNIKLLNEGAGTASGGAAGNVGTTATANANSSQFVSSFAQAY